jgi:hypothetical protein
MHPQHLLQSRRRQLLGMLKYQAHNIAVRPMPRDLWLKSKAFELAEVELPFFAHESAIKPAKILGAALPPGMANARDTQLDGVAGIPFDFDGGIGRAPPRAAA